jgi:hypothetical protein
MKTPNVTQAQVVALIVWASTQAVAFGWVSSHKEQVLLSASATVIAVALKLSDALIRGSRSKLGIELAAEVHQLNVNGLALKVQALEKVLQDAQAAAAAVEAAQPAPAPVVAPVPPAAA